LSAGLPELVDVFGKSVKLWKNLSLEIRVHSLEGDYGIVHRGERSLVFRSLFENLHDLLKVIFGTLGIRRSLLVVGG
jgi:hypothetical protein